MSRAGVEHAATFGAIVVSTRSRRALPRARRLFVGALLLLGLGACARETVADDEGAGEAATEIVVPGSPESVGPRATELVPLGGAEDERAALRATGAAEVAAGDEQALALPRDEPALPPPGDEVPFVGTPAPQLVSCLGNPAICTMPLIAAGMAHTVALKGDGTVWAWGYNGNGRLGDGTATSRTLPVQVGGGRVAHGSAEGRRHGLGLGLQRQRPARRRHHDDAARAPGADIQPHARGGRTVRAAAKLWRLGSLRGPETERHRVPRLSRTVRRGRDVRRLRRGLPGRRSPPERTRLSRFGRAVRPQ
jgi:hypothetical protein